MTTLQERASAAWREQDVTNKARRLLDATQEGDLLVRKLVKAEYATEDEARAGLTVTEYGVTCVVDGLRFSLEKDGYQRWLQIAVQCHVCDNATMWKNAETLAALGDAITNPSACYFCQRASAPDTSPAADTTESRLLAALRDLIAEVAA